MKFKKNKIFAVALLAMLILLSFGMTACSNQGGDTNETMTSSEASENSDEQKSLTSLEVAKAMGNGINLGNTMEACDVNGGRQDEIAYYETSWGQPVTSQEMIDEMKAAGFDSIRIPVSWVTNGMDNFEDGDYTIREDLLDRVEEIVNYALNNDMYVIINDHWDGGWWGMFGSADQETQKAAMNVYVSMWTQISERFKDYSDYVIFEAGNEELGSRLNDTDFVSDSGTLTQDECYEMNTVINQTFIDTVRASGGNNDDRFLLVAGYNTDIEMTCDSRFVMPTDTATDKLLLSVHYYTPWGYAGVASLSSWGTEKNYEEMNGLMKSLSKLTEQGYGVVIGEYAVYPKDDGSLKDNTLDFMSNLLDNCDLYGFVPMLWDCSNYFIRTDLAFFDNEMADFFMERSLSEQSNLTEEDIKTNAENAIEKALSEAEKNDDDAGIEDTDNPDKAIAWIMFNSGDYSTIYSVGDIYDPYGMTAGVVASDVEVTSEGTYTVELDFTGTGSGKASGCAFSAIGITNGEVLFPEYAINITNIEINGESYPMTGKSYTTSDDSICTRANIYNIWVTSVPDDARTIDGDNTNISPVLIDGETIGDISTISVTFDYKPTN